MTNTAIDLSTAGCPSWCTGLECGSTQLPSDRMHRGESFTLPGIQRHRRISADTGKVERYKDARSLLVIQYRYLTDTDDWIAISGEEWSLEITRETAARLAHGLHRILASAVQEGDL